MAVRLGDAIRTVEGDVPLPALVTRLGEETSIYDGPIGHAYDLTPVAARLVLDGEGDLPYLPEVLVTPWESDARALAALDAEHRYGWTKDGDRPG